MILFYDCIIIHRIRGGTKTIYLCEILKPGNLRTAEIYSNLEDGQMIFLSIGFHTTFFQISRNTKYFKLCFPHFLFDIPSSVR